MKPDFDLTPGERTEMLEYLAAELELFYARTESFRVTPDLDLERVIRAVRSHDLESPVEGREALSLVLTGMTEYAVHTPHPMYYQLQYRGESHQGAGHAAGKHQG